jgi:hypothetical protein
MLKSQFVAILFAVLFTFFEAGTSFYTEEPPVKLFRIHDVATRYNVSESAYRTTLEDCSVS